MNQELFGAQTIVRVHAIEREIADITREYAYELVRTDDDATVNIHDEFGRVLKDNYVDEPVHFITQETEEQRKRVLAAVHAEEKALDTYYQQQKYELNKQKSVSTTEDL
jgi:hypothetical protein